MSDREELEARAERYYDTLIARSGRRVGSYGRVQDSLWLIGKAITICRITEDHNAKDKRDAVAVRLIVIKRILTEAILEE